MPQINLLKQNSPSQNTSDILPSIAVKILFLVLVGAVVYYGWLFIQSRNLTSKINSTTVEINTNIQTALNTKEYSEILTRQTQLNLLSGLIDSHSYFSNLLPELANSTLKTATYANIRATADGGITMDVKVPGIRDIDKFLQVFDIAKFNQNFSNVKIGAFHKIQAKDISSYGFSVDLSYNPSLIKYHAPTATR